MLTLDQFVFVASPASCWLYSPPLAGFGLLRPPPATFFPASCGFRFALPASCWLLRRSAALCTACVPAVIPPLAKLTSLPRQRAPYLNSASLLAPRTSPRCQCNAASALSSVPLFELPSTMRSCSWSPRASQPDRRAGPPPAWRLAPLRFGCVYSENNTTDKGDSPQFVLMAGAAVLSRVKPHIPDHPR